MGLTRGDRLLFFTADDGVRGRELWRSTGTGGEGTHRVRDIFPGAGSSAPSSLTRLDDEVFFAADDGSRGRELWKSDGTHDGTRRVRDIRPGPEGSTPRALLAFRDRLYFAADDGTHGDELWRSDGTTSGTSLLVDLTPYTDSLGRPVSTNPRNLTALGDRLFFFTADEDVSDFMGLWRSDGTPGGTFSVDSGPDDIRELTPVGDDLLFYIGGNEGDESLRRTDGTLAGTLTLLDVRPRRLAELTPVGRGVFFRYRTGTELLRSDGTVAGTRLVRDLGSPPRELTGYRGRLFFTAEDATHGRELWVSDGTDAGTVLFKDLAPGVAGSTPEALTVAGATSSSARRRRGAAASPG